MWDTALRGERRGGTLEAASSVNLCAGQYAAVEDSVKYGRELPSSVRGGGLGGEGSKSTQFGQVQP